MQLLFFLAIPSEIIYFECSYLRDIIRFRLIQREKYLQRTIKTCCSVVVDKTNIANTKTSRCRYINLK